MMDSLIAVQSWPYSGMTDGIRSTGSDPAGLLTLLAAAFLFGIVHALMPGHGKSVLVSYHLGRPGRLIEGVATGTVLAVTHVGTAVILILLGIAAISRSFSGGGRAPAFETASAILIVLIGVYLVASAIWMPRHHHARDGKMLGFVTGLVPCPLTTFILSYALARNNLAVGLLAVAGMLAGIIVTLVSFAAAAVLIRTRLTALLSRTEHLRDRVAWTLELTGALAVLLLGVTLLARQIG